VDLDPQLADELVASTKSSNQTAILATWGTSDAEAQDAEPVKLGVSSVVCTSSYSLE
jgi:hypothetical protein